MTNLARKLYSPIVFDSIFAVVGVVSVVGIVRMVDRAVPEIAAPDDPLTKALAVIGVILATVAFITVTTKLDQKCADDFTFHTLTKSAFMAILAYIVGAALWQAFFAHNLGPISSYLTLAVVIATWSLTYFWVRIRGTGA